MGKVYRGIRDRREITITVDGRPLWHVVRHSQEMAWGYGGSGAADLALSILTEHLGDVVQAKEHYRAFKREFVAKWPFECFQITEEAIERWLAWRAELAKKPAPVEPAPAYLLPPGPMATRRTREEFGRAVELVGEGLAKERMEVG